MSPKSAVLSAQQGPQGCRGDVKTQALGTPRLSLPGLGAAPCSLAAQKQLGKVEWSQPLFYCMAVKFLWEGTRKVPSFSLISALKNTTSSSEAPARGSAHLSRCLSLVLKMQIGSK